MSPSFGHMVRILHWCTDQAMTAALEKMELTAAQGHIMGYLNHCPDPPCPKDVEERFRLSHPTVSGILSRLEQKGFLELISDSKDRRYKRIRVLPKGVECHQRIHEAIAANEELMVRDFTEEERELFHRLLTRAIANMGHSPCHHKPKEENSK